MVDAVLPDLYNEIKRSSHQNVDFLLPNGILVPLKVDVSDSFAVIKKFLWQEIQQYPLSNQLSCEDFYCFCFINSNGAKEEVLDEGQNIQDVRLFWPMLKLVERKGDKLSKTLNCKIDALVGNGPMKLSSYSCEEVTSFKKAMIGLCDYVLTGGSSQVPLPKFQWRYPLRLRQCAQIPPHIQAKLDGSTIALDIDVKHADVNIKLIISVWLPPIKVVADCFMRNPLLIRLDPQNYILKVASLEEYLYGSYPLIQYKYIYNCIVKRRTPRLWLLPCSSVTDIQTPLPEDGYCSQDLSSELYTYHTKPATAGIFSWSVNEDATVTVSRVNKVPLADNSRVKLFVGLYHGNETLSGLQETEEFYIQDGCCDMNSTIVFSITVSSIPRSAHVCFSLCAASIVRRKNARDFTPIAWVNIPIYNYESRFMEGEHTLPMWPFESVASEDVLYPIGSVAANPLGYDAPMVTLLFPHYGAALPVIYPPYDKVKAMAADNMEPVGTVGSPSMKVSKFHMEQLRQIVHQDEVFEQDKDILWLMRYELRDHHPHYLSRLWLSVRWNSPVDVAKAVVLLETWPLLDIDYALELLDCDFSDEHIRKFAVRCLDAALCDDDLSQYLLQLVQSLRFETYLVCPMVSFLLSRALCNRHLGHKLFWLLRSELHNPTVTVRHSLILECYLRAKVDHCDNLYKQITALDKLAFVSQLSKMNKCRLDDQKTRQQAILDMQCVLGQKIFRTTLSNLSSPLCPLNRLKELRHVVRMDMVMKTLQPSHISFFEELLSKQTITLVVAKHYGINGAATKFRVEKCRVMKSKMHPLWLVWSSIDPASSNISLLYKDGDDLRQDMLTLQILQLMDNLWQSEGLDLRMNTYKCVATGDQRGLIEVVAESETIANIQMWYKKNSFDKRALLEWLRDIHGSGPELDFAVEEFMMSCAGYCVATYILGIGDRHNDNIMLKKSGQLFHIDFGHFLGNFKSKYGVRRERVPFVLTTHFVHVIRKGGNGGVNFKRFQETCEKAYLIIRSRSQLLMSMFMMMLCSGIPQLTCRGDVEYLTETLRPRLSESEALEHFRCKFKEALRNSWTSSVNFFFHNLTRDR